MALSRMINILASTHDETNNSCWRETVLSFFSLLQHVSSEIMCALFIPSHQIFFAKCTLTKWALGGQRRFWCSRQDLAISVELPLKTIGKWFYLIEMRSYVYRVTMIPICLMTLELNQIGPKMLRFQSSICMVEWKVKSSLLIFVFRKSVE